MIHRQQPQPKLMDSAGFKTVWRHIHAQLSEARVKQVRVPLLARVALTLQFCITSDCVVCSAGSYLMHTQQTSHQRSWKRTKQGWKCRTVCRCLLSRAGMDLTSPKILTSLSGGLREGRRASSISLYLRDGTSVPGYCGGQCNS
jgi:hypothetical protein